MTRRRASSCSGDRVAAPPQIRPLATDRKRPASTARPASEDMDATSEGHRASGGYVRGGPAGWPPDRHPFYWRWAWRGVESNLSSPRPDGDGRLRPETCRAAPESEAARTSADMPEVPASTRTAHPQ